MTTRVIVLVPEQGAFKVEAVTQQLRKGGHAQIDPDYWEETGVQTLEHKTFQTVLLHGGQRLLVRERPFTVDFAEDKLG